MLERDVDRDFELDRHCSPSPNSLILRAALATEKHVLRRTEDAGLSVKKWAEDSLRRSILLRRSRNDLEVVAPNKLGSSPKFDPMDGIVSQDGSQSEVIYWCKRGSLTLPLWNESDHG